jgi:hypothetical protein
VQTWRGKRKEKKRKEKKQGKELKVMLANADMTQSPNNSLRIAE